MKQARRNTTKQINRAYHGHIKALIRGQHEREIFDALSAGKNSYLRLDRLESSSFDKSWIEVIEGVIFDLGEIIANPRMHTKTEGVVTPVELAKKITGESVQHLAGHSQYVKEIDEYGNVIPSKLLSVVSDDDLHTYENRFIATLVRRLLLFVEKRYEYILKYAELQNEEILYFKNHSIVDGANVEIETKIKVSYSNDDEEALRNSDYIERIKETRRYILYFYNSPFMKALKNERDVRNPIIQTNIIRKAPKYHHCYEVYRFIETYDRLGVNYKIDENYSLFNNEEMEELNRTVMANYLTLRGKDMSGKHKTVSKVYKPRILTSLDDESFIYGPLLEGPIEFARVDEQYLAYLESKLKKDLPLHPTKKEKDYYEEEYAQKAETKQDEKQLADLLKRRQREVNNFEREVSKILEKREEARLNLLEQEKAVIKQEENDMLEEARQSIIAASNEDVENGLLDENQFIEVKRNEQEEQEQQGSTVTFDDAVKDIWPGLSDEIPLRKADDEKPQKGKVKKVKQPKVVPTPAPIKEEPQLEPVKEEVKPEPVKEEPVSEPIKEEKPVERKEYVPTVSFNDAADEIWPQLSNPKPLEKEPAKEEAKPVKKPQEKKPAPKKEVKKAEPKPVEKPKEEPKKEAKPVKKVAEKPAPKKEEKKLEPKPEVKKVEEKKEAPKPVKKPIKEEAPKKAEPKPAPEESKKPTPKVRVQAPVRPKIPGNFIVKTPKGYYVGPNKYSISKEDGHVFDDFNDASDIKKAQGGKIIKL